MFKTIACSLVLCFSVACGSADEPLPQAPSADATGSASSSASDEAPVSAEVSRALAEGSELADMESVCNAGNTHGHFCYGLGCCRAGVSCNNCAH